MVKVICEVCHREIDSRGLSGHMKTHSKKVKPDVTKGNDNDEVISYPSNEQKIEETGTVVDLDESPSRGVKKTVKKQVKKQVKPASKPASSPSSSPDTRGQRNAGSTSTEGKRSTSSAHTKNTGHPKDSGVTEAEHKEEWKGFFRD